jgi:DNA invertase Pin-like site-specific DNA recombinase
MSHLFSPLSMNDGRTDDRAGDVAVTPGAESSVTLSAPVSPVLRPRAVRKRRTPKEERGLPPDGEIRKLAQVYLDMQRKLWPDLIQHGLLPAPSDEVLESFMLDFKRRHGGAAIEPLTAAVLEACGQLAATYSRYSCENSRPESISDQLVNELRKAHEEKRFVPWVYVFADYSVTGLDSSRRGYTSLKTLLSDPIHPIETVYIDDFTRSSRDDIEWWKLASLIRRLRKRLIAASESFDLSNEDADTKIGLFNILTKLFLKSLRQKVRRGMRGAARRGHSLGRPALGYALTHAINTQGHYVYGPDGLPIWALCIDPASRKYVEMAFQWYGEPRWSMGRIAREFNRLKVDSGVGWTAASIRQLLKRLLYIGVMIYNRHRQERDLETGKIVVQENPRKEWEVVKMPHLRLIPDALWKKVALRLKQVRTNHPRTGKPWSRNANSASTLFSGTACCEYCSTPERLKELVLTRSAGDYKTLRCICGTQGRHGCKLTTSKSVRIVEQSLLTFLRDTLLGDAVVEQLVEAGNACISPWQHDIATSGLARCARFTGSVQKASTLSRSRPRRVAASARSTECSNSRRHQLARKRREGEIDGAEPFAVARFMTAVRRLPVPTCRHPILGLTGVTVFTRL